jgi:sialidase-1
VFGFNEAQAMAYKGNPIDDLQGLAAFKVPVLHVIGLNDHIVPPDENTFVLVQKYEKLGGPAYVYPMTRGPRQLEGHHFTIEHPGWWADFIFKHSFPVQTPIPYENYFRPREGIPSALEKFEHQKTGTVAFLGGSITFNPGWRDMVIRYLGEQFPDTKFRFISAGIPSLGSLPHAFRVQRDVLDSAKVDLMFVEAAVNDRVNGTDSLTQLRSLEGIVRHARKSNPRMDIVLMSFADPDKLKDYSEGRMPAEIENHELVAEHYHLPSINMAGEVYDKIKAGEFSWQYDFKNLHPAAYGQQLYFQTIKSLLWRCMDEAERKDASVTADYAMPMPLDKWNFDQGQYFSIRDARVRKGWNLVTRWQPESGAHTRPGFVDCPMLVATQPGAALDLPFSGTAIGMAVVSGSDAGVVRYRVDHGPTRTIDLYTQWSRSLYLPWYVLFEGALKPGKHVLHLTLTADKNPRSTGTACYIEYFLLNR